MVKCEICREFISLVPSEKNCATGQCAKCGLDYTLYFCDECIEKQESDYMFQHYCPFCGWD